MAKAVRYLTKAEEHMRCSCDIGKTWVIENGTMKSISRWKIDRLEPKCPTHGKKR